MFSIEIVLILFVIRGWLYTSWFWKWFWNIRFFINMLISKLPVVRVRNS